jgi:hypothetical protein
MARLIGHTPKGPAMPVTDHQMVLLMAYLAGEEEVAQRVRTELAASGTAEGFAELVYAAFVIAARRRFSPAWTRSGVIRFVAEVRALLSEQPDVLDPLAAEHQLRSALGEKMTSYPAAEDRARAQVILLDALVQSADLDDAGLHELLDEARQLAGQMLAGPASADSP